MNPTYPISPNPQKALLTATLVPALAAPPAALRPRAKRSKPQPKTMSLTELYDALKAIKSHSVAVKYLSDDAGTPLVQVFRYYITPEDAAAIRQRGDKSVQRHYLLKNIKNSDVYHDVRPNPVKVKLTGAAAPTAAPCPAAIPRPKTTAPRTATPYFAKKSVRDTCGRGVPALEWQVHQRRQSPRYQNLYR